MSGFQLALLIGAAIVALVSYRQQHALLWICAGVASFVVSTLYARADFPFPPAITALCDAAICFGIAFYRHEWERWEKYLFLLFQGSVLLSIMHLAGAIESHWAYVVALEGINWLALGVIGGTAALSWIGNATHDRNWLVHYLRGADRALHAKIHPIRGR